MHRDASLATFCGIEFAAKAFARHLRDSRQTLQVCNVETMYVNRMARRKHGEPNIFRPSAETLLR